MNLLKMLPAWLSLQRKNSSLDLFREIYGGVLGGREAKSGASVTWQTALQVSTVHACVRLIANGVAQAKWQVFEKRDGVTKEAADHPLTPLLRSAMSERLRLTKYEVLVTALYHLLLTGNAYLFIGRVGRARTVREIYPLEPHRVTVSRAVTGELRYRVSFVDGQSSDYGSDEIWHIRGPSWNSWLGLDATRIARESIGLAISLEESHAELHRNGPHFGGIYSVSGVLSKESHANLQSHLIRHATGGPDAGKPLILDNSADFKSTTMTSVDAQHIETRNLQIVEICRHFGVIPALVGVSEKASGYNGVEQQSILHVTHTLTPWFTLIEQSADMYLLSEADRKNGLSTQFNANALMRGAAKDRAEYFAKALGAGGAPGWLTQNEVREIENANPLPGGDSLNRGSITAQNQSAAPSPAN